MRKDHLKYILPAHHTTPIEERFGRFSHVASLAAGLPYNHRPQPERLSPWKICLVPNLGKGDAFLFGFMFEI